jgi:hypothetical protein
LLIASELRGGAYVTIRFAHRIERVTIEFASILFSSGGFSAFSQEFW